MREQYQLAVNAIDQTRDPNLLDDCMRRVSVPLTSDAQRSINYQSLCERFREAFEQLQVARTGLGEWNIVSYRLSYLFPIRWLGDRGTLPKGLSSEEWDFSELRASAVMAGFTGFVLPMLLGFLGAFPYVYRDLDRCLRAATLVPGDGLHGSLRLLLGMILGGLLGILWTSGDPIHVEGVALSLTALAFFVGYSVEVVFQMLDSIVIKVASTIQKKP